MDDAYLRKATFSYECIKDIKVVILWVFQHKAASWAQLIVKQHVHKFHNMCLIPQTCQFTLFDNA